jgi:hypothetical protein
MESTVCIISNGRHGALMHLSHLLNTRKIPFFFYLFINHWIDYISFLKKTKIGALTSIKKERKLKITI